jgi:hypothetical protein
LIWIPRSVRLAPIMARGCGEFKGREIQAEALLLPAAAFNTVRMVVECAVAGKG